MKHKKSALFVGAAIFIFGGIFFGFPFFSAASKQSNDLHCTHFPDDCKNKSPAAISVSADGL